jgi:rhodanese-related sulfurtransferase
VKPGSTPLRRRRVYSPPMDLLALAIGTFGLLVALISLAGRAAMKRRLEDVERDARRRAENLSDELEQRLATLRALMAAAARGVELTPEMIEEGRLWRDADTTEGVAMVAAGGVHVLDVRTPQETAGGVIPGAQLIPIDQLEERWREVPTGRRTLVYCAGGGRSAAACEFLSAKGYGDLHNLAGGFTSWTGPSERPA